MILDVFSFLCNHFLLIWKEHIEKRNDCIKWKDNEMNENISISYVHWISFQFHIEIYFFYLAHVSKNIFLKKIFLRHELVTKNILEISVRFYMDWKPLFYMCYRKHWFDIFGKDDEKKDENEWIFIDVFFDNFHQLNFIVLFDSFGFEKKIE